MSHFSYRRFFSSFRYAIRGIINLILTEQNARVHFFATILVGLSAYFFHISRLEAVVLFFAVVLVFVIEIVNTAIEKLLDLVHPGNHQQIAFIKDALAGAVLIAAIIASVVGVLIFTPYIRQLF